MDCAVSNTVEMSMKKNSIMNSVHVDDWTAELAIIAS